MEKLVCDKCGFELTEPEDINLAIDRHGSLAGSAEKIAAVNREGSSPVNISLNARAKCSW